MFFFQEIKYFFILGVLQTLKGFSLRTHPLAHGIIYHIYSTLSWAIENIREAGIAFHLHQDVPKRHSENKTYERVSVCGQKR